LLVDTHCHLNFDAFEKDRDQVVAQAREIGLVRILNPGITSQTSLAAIQLSRQYPEVYAAVGIHPTEVDECDSSTLSHLIILAQEPKVVAIGEIGLDDYWDQSSFGQQIECLRKMLVLAEQAGKPIIIHIRNHSKDSHKAIEAAYNILSDWCRLLPSNSILKLNPGVLHSFDDQYSWAERFIQLNFLLGISARITYRSADRLREVVVNAPLENLLVETDAPFVSPEPDRRERNQPGNVKVVAERIAQIREMPYEQVASITTSNARRLFAW
jgi:TatD DNase family protein